MIKFNIYLAPYVLVTIGLSHADWRS